MKKGQIYEGIIERVDFPNKGIVFVPEEEQNVIVKNGIPGQKIRFMINKFKRGNAEGRLLEVLEKSPLETREPVCSIFPACGGCMYQTMPYEEQVKMKEGQIRRIMDPVVKGEYLFEGVKHSPKEFHYRNKMEFSFGDEFKDGPLSLGLHKKGSTYDVLTAGDCQLVHEDMDKILLCVLNYFKERNVSYYKKMQHVGYLRHLLLRRGDTTGEILVNLVTTTQEEYDLTPLVEELLALELEGKIVGILHILNDSLSDVVKSDETRILYGQDFFYEKLLGLEFKITPFSFFQPNSKGAEVLYETVREYIGDIEALEAAEARSAAIVAFCRFRAELVILCPLVRIGKHGICLIYLLEFCLRVLVSRVHIGMIFLCKRTVRLFYFVIARSLRNSENFIIISHLSTSVYKLHEANCIKPR